VSRFEIVAALVATTVAALLPLCRRGVREPRTRWARGVLWAAIASPLPFLLVDRWDRPCVIVSGPRGSFEATRLLSLAAASAALVLTAIEGVGRRTSPRRGPGSAAWVFGCAVLGTIGATALVL